MWVVVDGKGIQKSPIIGTGIVEYSAWEPSALVGRHSSITSIAGEWYGRIGTRWPPPELERLPAWSDERMKAVGRWHEEQYQEAYDLIIRAFPQAAKGRRSMGIITVTEEHNPSGSSGRGKAWLPVPDPLGIIERATEDAPVQLRDPLRRVLPTTRSGHGRLTRDDVRIEVWEERDRLHIGIQDKETGDYIVSWWDDEAREMFEDGFFKRGRGLKESVLTYAEEVGLLAR